MFEVMDTNPGLYAMSWDYACELDGVSGSVLDLVR